jgi:CRP-like cAMP-binding protein
MGALVWWERLPAPRIARRHPEVWEARVCGKIPRMADDLLSRILGEIRERKEASRAAYEESQRLERALAALGADRKEVTVRGRDVQQRRRAGGERRAAPGANRDAIVAVVRERPGVTAGEIAFATGIARATVTSTAARLTGGGTLERVELPGGGIGFRVAEPASA